MLSFLSNDINIIKNHNEHIISKNVFFFQQLYCIIVLLLHYLLITFKTSYNLHYSINLKAPLLEFDKKTDPLRNICCIIASFSDPLTYITTYFWISLFAPFRRAELTSGALLLKHFLLLRIYSIFLHPNKTYSMNIKYLNKSTKPT